MMRGQTYVERLTPVGGARLSPALILVHGGGQSGMVRNRKDFPVSIY